MPQPLRHREPVALVLAGGGARGAYEMGALAALLPELEDGERPGITIGTSVGAINTSYLAANADKSPDELVSGGLSLWRGLRYQQVLRPLVSVPEVRRLVEYVGEVVGLPRTRVRSILDPGPLRSTLAELIEFGRIGANVDAGHLLAAAVIATSGLTNLSVVFHKGGPNPKTDVQRGITYVGTELTEDHVRASAAIPVLFPAVPIDDVVRRWYFDGGTRLNAPIKPALALGGRRVIVIALNSLVPRHDLKEAPRPDALDGATQFIQAVLVDPLVNDVHTLATINEMLLDDTEEQMRAHETRTGRHRIPYMLIAPEDPAEIGRVAAEIYRRHYGSPLDLVRSPNLAGLGRLLNVPTSPNHGELLSYLFFAEEFTERLIELGRRDAQRWLDDKTHDDGRWQLGPLP